MAFTATTVENMKYYQLPQSVYDTMVQNGEIDSNSIYLTTDGEETTHSHKTQLTDVTVASSAWSSSTRYSDYPQQATISVAGATPDMLPEIVFDVAEAVSGNFSPVARSTTGGVIIYAKEAPTLAITIPTIILWN